MGTATFSIEKYGPANAARGDLVASGAHTTTGTANNLTDGAAGAGSAVVGVAGQVLTIVADVPMRVKMGGETATATDGHIVPGGTVTNLHIHASGTISIVDI